LTELVEAMDDLGWGVYSFDHEDAVGQFEVDFDYCEAGEAADRFVLLRMMACAIARKHGCYATWMPKPMLGRTGSGAHLNVSLHEYGSEVNLFKRADGADGLSEIGQHFLGGVMAHLPAIVAVACPTVNSYKRMMCVDGRPGLTQCPYHSPLRVCTLLTVACAPCAVQVDATNEQQSG